MIISPHMSTGGCPQVVAKKVELLKDYYNVVVIEYEMLAWSYVVQRNRVINMIGDKFISLSENKEYDLFNAIEDYNPDYIMMEEFPLVNLEKAQLEALAEKRQALLKKRSTSPIQKVSTDGDIQLEF